MSSDTMYRILLGTVFVLLITLVIYVGINITDKEPVSEVSQNKNIVVEPYNEDEVTNDTQPRVEEDRINVVAKYVDIYSECEHEIENTEQYYDTVMETAKQESRKKHQEYSLVDETGNILIFERVYKGKCPNHFLVKVEENFLNIYRLNEKKEYELYQQSEIELELLREGIKEKLEIGIQVDGLSDLFILLEDIEI